MASNASAPVMDLTTDSDADSLASADNLAGVFNVNRILFEQESDGKKLYLIEWENYIIEESTWEPEENIDSKQTLRDWEDERLRQREGLSTPFDLDDFYKRQKTFRKKEKEKRREKEREISSSNKPRSRQPTRRNSVSDDDISMSDSSDSSDSPLMNKARSKEDRRGEETRLDQSGRARPKAKVSILAMASNVNPF